MVNDPEDIKRLVERIKLGEVVLFLGAGATKAAGGPTEMELCEVISNTLTSGKLKCNDLAELSSLVISQPGIDRKHLEKVVVDYLEPLTPSDAHFALTKYHWPAIFTTNYDTVLEKAYAMSPEKAQRLNPMVKAEDSFIISRSEVNLYHLNGSISYLHDRQNPLVLTMEDWHRTQENRRQMLEILKRLSEASTWLFVGYSFNDRIIINLIEEISSHISWQFINWSYSIMPNDDKYKRHFFQQKKIIPIIMDFAEFGELINKDELVNYSKEYHDKRINPEISIPEQRLQFSPKLREELAHTFDILTLDDLAKEGNPTSFYRGNQPSWGDLARDFDMKRKLTGDVENRIIDEYNNIEKPCSLFVITSSAGSGKSTTLKRIAYNLFKTRGMPVLTLKSSGRFDWQAISSLYKKTEKRLLLLADDADLYYPDFRRLYLSLCNHAVPVTILAAARKAQWNNKFNNESIAITDEFHLDDKLNSNEMNGLFEKLHTEKKIKITPIKNKEYWINRWEKIGDHQILVIMREVADGGEFDKIIIDEYEKIQNEHGKKAYYYVSLLFRFRYPIDRLLLKDLVCPEESWQYFFDEIIKVSTEEIIIEDYEPITGEGAFRSRHSVIATVLTDAVGGHKDKILDGLLSIIKSMNSNSQDHKTLARNLAKDDDIRKYLGEYSLISKLLMTLVEKYPTDIVLIQHLGIFKMHEDDLSSAEDYFERALQIEPHNSAVIHSMGELYKIKALAAENESMETLYALRAENYYMKARTIANTEHGYHSHALLCLLRARKAKDINKKQDLLTQSLEVITEGINSLSPQDVNKLPGLKADVLAGLGNIDESRAMYQKLSDEIPTSEIYIRWGWLEASLNNYQKALDLAFEAEKLDTHNPRSTILYLTCLHKLNRIDDKNWLKHIENAEKILTDSHYAKFLLGVAYWANGKEHEAKRMFFAARKQNIDSYSFPAIRLILTDGNQPRVFIGNITSINDKDSYISNLETGLKVWFRCKYNSNNLKMNEQVKYEIGFNYYGPVARNIQTTSASSR